MIIYVSPRKDKKKFGTGNLNELQGPYKNSICVFLKYFSNYISHFFLQNFRIRLVCLGVSFQGNAILVQGPSKNSVYMFFKYVCN